MNDNRGGQHRVRAKIECRSGHLHEICVLVRREVHPDLRCSPDQGQGYTQGGGGGCTLPPGDYSDLVERELRDRYQDSRRRGWVQIAA